ncbi:MAG: PaaI family thioesterase [Deltaproteobacteria bacterium]|nr:PaaI family thioesterase [Deltaproteobacteria bacterium]
MKKRDHGNELNQRLLEARCAELVALFEKAPIKHTFGMELSYDENGCAVFDMPHNPGLDHALGDTHGGIIATLLDNAGWFTAAVRYDNWINTAEMQLRLLEPVLCEPLRAKGKLIRNGRNLAVCEMEVRSASGRLVAIGSAMFAVSNKQRRVNQP